MTPAAVPSGMEGTPRGALNEPTLASCPASACARFHLAQSCAGRERRPEIPPRYFDLALGRLYHNRANVRLRSKANRAEKAAHVSPMMWLRLELGNIRSDAQTSAPRSVVHSSATSLPVMSRTFCFVVLYIFAPIVFRRPVVRTCLVRRNVNEVTIYKH